MCENLQTFHLHIIGLRRPLFKAPTCKNRLAFKNKQLYYKLTAVRGKRHTVSVFYIRSQIKPKRGLERKAENFILRMQDNKRCNKPELA